MPVCENWFAWSQPHPSTLSHRSANGILQNEALKAQDNEAEEKEIKNLMMYGKSKQINTKNFSSWKQYKSNSSHIRG